MINAVIIPDKYEYIRTLGIGRDNVAYLVRHKQLGNVLAMKTASYGLSGSAQLVHEMNLVRNLHYPGIPKLIDVILQEDHLYVLQEFVSGVSLGEFLSNKISLSQFLSVSGQLVSILNYLHTVEEEPILYLDFKPEHVHIRGEQVYLLDYGMAARCKQGKATGIYYGTSEYSAPEVLEEHYATVQSDIYSLGKIMERMVQQTIAKNYWERIKLQKIKKVISECVRENEDLRYNNVNEILIGLKQSDRRWQKPLQIQKIHLKATVAVIGTHHRVGTTHVATGLTHCCNMSGLNGVYVEETAKQWLRQSSVAETSSYGEDRKLEDLVQRGRFVGLPAYGPFYEPVVPEMGIFIRDLGVVWDGFYPEAYDKVILVLGSRYWEEEETLSYIKEYAKAGNCIFVCSATPTYRVRQLAQMSGVPIFSWGYDQDIFRMPREKRKIVYRLLRKELNA